MSRSIFTIRDSALLWALIAGGLLRLLPLFFWPDWGCVRDECSYLKIANRMEDGLGMTSSSGWLWAPGYPFLLAFHSMVLGEAKLIKGVQIALSLAAIIVLYALGRRLGNRRTGRLAAWIQALNPTQIFFSQSLWAESIYGSMLVFCLLFFLQLLDDAHNRKKAFSLGMLLGAMALLRGLSLYLIPVFLICFWRFQPSSRRLWRQLSRIVGGAALFIVPYSVYASLSFERFVLVDRTMGQMMWLGNNEFEPIGFDVGGQLSARSFDEHVDMRQSTLKASRSDGLAIRDIQPNDNFELMVPIRAGGKPFAISYRFSDDLLLPVLKSNEAVIAIAGDDKTNAERVAFALSGEDANETIAYGADARESGVRAQMVATGSGWGLDVHCLEPGSHGNAAWINTSSAGLSGMVGKRYFLEGRGRNHYPPRPKINPIESFSDRREKWDRLNEWAMQREDAAIDEGMDWISRNPMVFIERIPGRLSQMMTPHSFLTRHLRYGGWPGIPGWLSQMLVVQTAVWTFILSLGGVYATVSRFRASWAQLTLGILSVHFMAVACFAGLSRYRVPLEPLLALALALLISRFSNRTDFSPAAIFCSLLLLPLLLWNLPAAWPVWSVW